MRTKTFKAALIKAGLAASVLLLGSGTALAQQTINLTAGPSSTTMPDGTVVPMWGYTCGAAAVTTPATTATCTALNPAVQTLNTTPPAGYTVGSAWSPVVITVPAATAPTLTSLTINLTNNLLFTPAGTGATANAIPTSIAIVGQVGGGLGAATVRTVSPDHSTAQECPSWFIAANPPGTPCTAPTPGVTTNTPPAQLTRVQSFGTEVEAVAVVAAGGTPTACTAAGTGVASVSGCATLTWSNLKPGTYLLESGTHPSIQVPMGLIGVLVVTTAPTSATSPGTAYPAVTTASGTAPAIQYSAELPLEFSEIDPVQNAAVAAAVMTNGFLETNVWSGMYGACGNQLNANGTSNLAGATTATATPFGTCYPPAVNYTPFYFLINGVAFNKTNATGSVFNATAGAGVTTGITGTGGSGTGTVLVRLVNAGLRMHVPSIVGSLTQGFNGSGVPATVGGFTLIAEDGNPVPGVQVPGNTTVPAAPRVQTDVFMAAGKVFDVMVNMPAAGSTALPIFARDLGLSADSSARDAGMIAYIGVNGAALPAATGAFAAAQAVNDTYPLMVAGQPFSVTDPSKGVIGNDVNVFGVTLLSGPSSGTLSCTAQPQNTTAGICRNGTFTYTPNTGSTATSDSFTYCANNGFTPPVPPATTGTCSSAALTAMVTLGPSTLAGSPTAITQSYTAAAAGYIKVQSPGLLLGNSDPSGLPLSVVIPATPPTGVVFDAKGGFIATGGATGFSYTVQNSQGRTATGTVNITYPTPSNLSVNVVDAQSYSTYGCNPLSAVSSTGITCNGTTLPFITDYRWIIEEDLTFWVDPNCTTNTSITTPGCPAPVAAGGTIPTFGTNFHASTMGYVAQGCTGPLSCEGGQTMLDTRPGLATTGTHIPAVCDLGNGACRPDPNCTALPCTTAGGTTAVMPSSVHLDPTKRYYISILPGDAANPFPAYVGPPNCLATPFNPDGSLNTHCGHSMGGAPIPPPCNVYITGSGATSTCTATFAPTATYAPVVVKVAPTPFPTSKLSGIVFEDDFPLNGEQDGGGGNGTVAPIEPGLGGFEIILWDTFGGLGDFTGQDTHDMFNQPLSNALAGTIDPSTGLDACPLSAQVTASVLGGDGSQAGLTGRIVTCPKYESDNATLSPLAGQFLIANLMPDKFSVQAYPAADRIARGEEWLQTNTLDGQHPHDAFLRIGEPGYFQEFGPSGYHVAIGFANPAIINARAKDVCAGAYGSVGPCNNTIKGQADVQRISRTPDQRLYPSGDREGFAWTQCWVSLGDPDAEDFMFTKCDANGNFEFKNVPGGTWRITIGDQWNDQIIDGLSTPANVGCTSTAPNGVINPTTCPGGQTLQMGNIGVQQWQSNLYTRYYVDDNKNGIPDPGELGVQQVYTRIRYRDGSNANALLTDPNGIANFNETFPLFNWYVVEPDLGRYKRTGTHTVYDAGGPADGSPSCGTSNGARACGTSTAYNFLANTYEGVPLPADLSVPGAVYCASADCATESASFAAGTAIPSSSTASTGRIDPPWVNGEGWSGMTSQGNWIEFGVAPYAACNTAAAPTAAGNYCAAVTTTAPGATTPTTKYVGENGGIHGHTAYAATRPFDDASQMIEQPWAPLVARVRVNLYQEGFAADGVTPTLTMVDTTTSSSWDDWAQGFYPGSTAGSGTGAGQKPYMSCPGQGTATGTNADLFFYSLYDQPEFLDYYNYQHNGGTLHTLPYNSQYKCYDAMHIWNQIQPAPYDGEYSFPSSLGINATTGKPLTTMGSTNGVASSMPGTNCTVCVANPDSTDVYRVGTPMLPPGKYVVEVILPPGYEVEKEEDKNLLIGDNFIAPANQQFAGLGGSIFILPDQASVASLYEPGQSGFNPSNYQNSTVGLGLNEELSGVPGTPGFQDPVWPCVGEMRVVPDYLSLFPQALETAPFAGATRPLCDRKEVTLADQMNVSAKFYIYTSTHIAAKFTGVITNDYTSEFDPFSPQFGEKFSPPNLPVSTKDYLGNEISRVYADHWGTYESLNFSTWEVNPPNITGYSPTMMVQCMNDSGPILDTRTTIPDPNNPANSISNMPAAGGTYGQLINDPLFNPHYSQFCYEEPYMPGLTTYLDTPVVPTSAFVGAAYNDVDCAYPDTTPAVKEVDGDGVGPWVSAAGNKLTITALGSVLVDNSAYSGPSANAVPFDLKKVQRHYGFGNSAGTVVLIDSTGASFALGSVSWSDTTITGTVPSGLANCPIQQQAQYGGSAAQCGQLMITTANTAGSGPSNAKQSIDTVTVTIGGKPPQHITATGSDATCSATATYATIQHAIDCAAPGDLLMVDPASHNEMVIMWKPVRLQGVGAASSIINANASPAGKLLDPWRRTINCLFGLSLSGTPTVGNTGTPQGNATYDPTGTYSCTPGNPGVGPNGNPYQYFTTPSTNQAPQIDRLPLEAVVGWDATVNGNLAEQLQEPSLMGAYEGAGITVLGKGVWTSTGENVWSDAALTGEGGAFPADALLLQNVPAGTDDEGAPTPAQYTYCDTPGTTTELVPNPYPSNFECNPSSIDGLSVTNSSQGGGGIFVHGWAHNLQIANNRVYNNAGTLSGGMSIGQGEFPISINVVATGTTPPLGPFALDAPGSCQFIDVVGAHLPYCLDMFVNVHNNYIANNASLGDELFSGTLSGGGGATFCTGSDYYKFNYNWVCGNQSSGEGGGMVHLGFIYNGDIEHNAFLLNQSINPTIVSNGGGIMVEGTPDTDPICGTQIDLDCPPGLSDGTGPGLIINANLIQANSADSGAGGGIRLNQVNGTDITFFPNGCVTQGATTLSPTGTGGTCAAGSVPASTYWNSVSITNNIISNNLAGWDGAGISLQDSLNVSIVNNTIAHNDSLASAGVLTQSVGTPQASAPFSNCVLAGGTTSCPQPSGVSSTPNSALLISSFPVAPAAPITCPAGQSAAGCRAFSNPILANNIIWQNRAFEIGVSGTVTSPSGTGTLNQQNLVSLYNAFTGTAAPVQDVTGACPTSGSSYWDIGVRGDTGPANHSGGGTLHPTNSVLTSTSGYGGASNSATAPPVISQYCNGSRVPPECSVADGCGGPSGYGVPPGIADATTPNPVFSLTPSATVDEGNNWINISWGPLAIVNPAIPGPAITGVTTTGDWGGGPPLANYSLSHGIDSIPHTVSHPATDFFGNSRGTGNFDPGAVEAQATVSVAPTITSVVPNSGLRGTTVAVTINGTNLSGATAVAVGGGVTATVTSSSPDAVTANFVISGTAALGAHNVTVTTPGGTVTATGGFTVAGPTLTSISPTSGVRGTTFLMTLTGTNLTGATAVTFNGTGVTAVITGTPTATTVTANVTITATAAETARNVTVATPGGNAVLTGGFTVTGATLTSISPTSGQRGTSFTMTLNGSNLAGATAVTFSGGGVTATGITSTATSITATVTVTPGAALGARNVTATTAIGATNTLTGAFTVVNPPAPTVTAITPTSGTGTVPVTLTGTNFVTGATVAVSGTGVTVSGVTVVNSTTITATFHVATTAAATARNVTVTTAGGTGTLTGGFTP